MTAASYLRHPALLLSCLLFVPSFAVAQGAANYCEPSPVLKAELKKASDVYNEEIPWAARQQKQKVILQELASKYPDDFHVQRRYQESRRAGFFSDTEALIAEYRAQMEKKAKRSGGSFHVRASAHRTPDQRRAGDH